MTTKNLQNDKIDLSLERIKNLLVHLGSPQTRFPIIHVAGTNAKGSTVHHLSSILQNVIGISTGTFTTPHLIEERDSCQVNGQTIDNTIWKNAEKIIENVDDQIKGPCTPFELLTAKCFVSFDLLKAFQRPEILLIEVGMGGALDATNVFNDRQVLASVITLIDFDHQSFLGNTLSEISRQKAGIIKQNGLCIIADQRRETEVLGKTEQPDCTKVLVRMKEVEDKSQCESEEILESIRSVAFERNARLVKSYLPWQALQEVQEIDPSSWNAMVNSNVRFSPTLSLSKIHKGQYISKTGDNVVAGPKLHHQATRASLMGSHSALQTLWSIARDETPFELGMEGSDEYEELRLRIAFALRDETLAKRSIEQCVASTRLAGRANWEKIRYPKNDKSDQMEVDHDSDQIGNQNIVALVDGAHNSSAVIALRQFIDVCIQSRLHSFGQGAIVTVTWILAFSSGKPVEEMAGILLRDKASDADHEIIKRVSSLSLDKGEDGKIDIRHRIACVPFSTPVEGMPWVECMPVEEVYSHFNGKPNVIEACKFDNLSSALMWAVQEGDGLPESRNMIVVAGSLYLVSDVYKFNTTIH